MFTDAGQAGTKVWICKMLTVTTSSPFFAKPTVVCCAYLVIRVFECDKKESCMDRDVMQAMEMIKNVIKETPDNTANRYSEMTRVIPVVLATERINLNENM